jgi:hypothetical protein
VRLEALGFTVVLNTAAVAVYTFTQGINKAVILGMVDTMLANKDVSGTGRKGF